MTTRSKRPLISLLLPTRGHADLLRQFCSSVAATAASPGDIETVLGVDQDDAATLAVDHVGLPLRRIILKPGLSMGQMNLACYGASTGRYVMLVNDDIIVRTPGWDWTVLDVFASVSDDIALLHVNDLLFRERLCTFPILSRRACETVGLCPAEYWRYKIDDHIYDTYSMLAHVGHRRIFYLPDVVFEHLNYENRSAPARAEPTQHVFQADGARAYRPNPTAIEKDHAFFMSAFPQRQKDALALAGLIESRRDAEARRKRRTAARLKLAALPDPYGYRVPGLVQTVASGTTDIRQNRTTVVIVTADIRRPHAAECLRRVKEYSPGAELVILDNGSAPDFSHPREMNRAIRSTRSRYLVLLDDDVWVEPGWLEGMHRAMDRDTAVVTPVHRDGSGRLSYSGVYLSGDGTGSHEHTNDMPAAPRDVMCACSAALLLDLEKCGGILMDERYAKYYFDLVHTLEVWESGYRTVCAPEAVVIHLGGATAVRGTAAVSTLNENDRRLFVAQWIDSGRMERLSSGIWRKRPHVRAMVDLQRDILSFDYSSLSDKGARASLLALVERCRPYPLIGGLLQQRLLRSLARLRESGDARDVRFELATFRKLSEFAHSLPCASFGLPQALEQFWMHAVTRSWTSAALYGAGKHTQRLLVELRKMNWPLDIRCIIDDAPTADSIGTIPVVRPSEAARFDFDVVVLSSDAFELEMIERVRSWEHVDKPVVPLYNRIVSELLESDYKGYNLVRHGAFFYAVSIKAGDLQLPRCTAATLKRLEESGQLLRSRDLDNLKARVQKAASACLAPLRDTLERNGWKRVALYGAGRFTSRLLRISADLAPPLPVALVLDDAPKAGELCGIPIRRPETLRDGDVDVVVASSDCFENILLEKAQAWRHVRTHVTGLADPTVRRTAGFELAGAHVATGYPCRNGETP